MIKVNILLQKWTTMSSTNRINYYQTKKSSAKLKALNVHNLGIERWTATVSVNVLAKVEAKVRLAR